MTFAKSWLVVWLILLCQLTSAWAYVEIPKLESRVTDLTGSLSADQSQALESKLAAFEAKKGSQIAVLIVPTTQPEDIAEFGIKVSDLWRIGRKGIDDGLILIIAKNDRKIRVEVNYGLEGVIPDAIAKRIGTETIAPYFFKNDDYYGGINAGVDQIMGLIEGEQLPAPTKTNATQKGDGGFIFLLFGGLFAGSVLSSMFGRVAGGLTAGIGSGVLAYLLLGFGIGAILVGIIVFFLTSARSGGGGGWSNGGGGSWGGGSSGGSWSGGGGSGGGGGATSSW